MAAISSERGRVLTPMDRPRSLWRDAFERLSQNQMALASLFILLCFAVIGIFADQLAPWPYNFQSRARPDRGNGGPALPPFWIHNVPPAASGKPGFWLGTDVLGEDVLSRIIYASRISLAAGIVPVLITMSIGIAVGMAAGYFGGRVDNLLMRFTDAIYAFPDLLFVILTVTALRNTALGVPLNGLLLIFLAMAVTGWVSTARLVRALVLLMREKEFIEAARSIGAPPWRIMLFHMFPHTFGPLIVTGAMAIPGYIMIEATLDFLGIGSRPPYPTWGAMINEGYNTMMGSPHMIWVPATCIALVTLACAFLSDGLRDALDPRMR